jgi:DNA-binding Xre family transcriptional regulator
MIDLKLLTPSQIAPIVGFKRGNDLVLKIKSVSHQSLSNLRKENPEKYEIFMLGLICKKLNIGIDDFLDYNSKEEVKR